MNQRGTASGEQERHVQSRGDSSDLLPAQCDEGGGRGEAKGQILKDRHVL